MSPANSRKRKRWSSAAGRASMVDESESSTWASLDGDLIRLIAERVLAGDITDYLHFRKVCHQWRSGTACPRGRSVFDLRFHPWHWMMFPEGYRLYPGHTKLRGLVRFFNLRTGAFANVRLPLFKDHFAMDSCDGLLVLQRDHDMAVRLLQPFTSDIVDLPSLATLLPQLPVHFDPIARAYMKETAFLGFIRNICAAVSYIPDDGGVVTAMLALTNQQIRRVAFATSKDQEWTLSSWETPGRVGILSLQGKLYFLTTRFQVLMVEPPQYLGSPSMSSSLLPPKLVASCSVQKIRPPLFLAESDSEILLVGYNGDYRSHIIVYRLADIMLGRFTPLKSIGDNSLFLWKRSVCVSSKSHPSIRGDSVVCLHPSFECIGEYHLGSSAWSTTTDGDVLHGPIPSPYTLIHHIYTCCDRYYWNKGQIYCAEVFPKWGQKSKWRAGG